MVTDNPEVSGGTYSAGSADVVIIGGGLAGLSATFEACEILQEKDGG